MQEFGHTLSLEGIAGFIEGRAQTALDFALSERGSEWIAETLADLCNKRGWKDGTGRLDLKHFFAQNPELKAQVTSELKQRIKKWLPTEVRRILRDDVFQGMLGSENFEELEKLSSKIDAALDVSANDAIDQFVGPMYDQMVLNLKQEMDFAGFGSWVDPTDLRGSVRHALSVGTLLDVASSQIGRVIGHATVTGIRSHITRLMDGHLPREAVAALAAGQERFDDYVHRVRAFLPGEKLRGLSHSLLARPLVKLPTEAYAGILAGSAAAHFAKAFQGVFVDPHELKRGIEVTKVMIWQLRKKQRVTLNIMQMAAIGREVARGLGRGADFDRVAAKIREPLDRIQMMADKVDREVLGRINDVQQAFDTSIRQTVGALQQELKKIKDAVTRPLQRQLDRVAGQALRSLPDGFNGIPPSWDDFKRVAERNEGFFGPSGHMTGRDLLQDMGRRSGVSAAVVGVQQGFQEANEKIAEGVASFSAQVLAFLHLIGPSAKILGMKTAPSTTSPLFAKLRDPVFLPNGALAHPVTIFPRSKQTDAIPLIRVYRADGDFVLKELVDFGGQGLE